MFSTSSMCRDRRRTRRTLNGYASCCGSDFSKAVLSRTGRSVTCWRLQSSKEQIRDAVEGCFTERHKLMLKAIRRSIAGLEEEIAEQEAEIDRRSEPRKQRECGQKSSHVNHGNKATITECAWAASRTKNTFISERYGRLAARRGKKRAFVATAHELLTIVYHMLKDQVVYSELGCGYVDQRRKNARIRYHLDVLKNLGVDIPEPSPVSA